MLNKILWVMPSLCFLSGCAIWDAGYTDNKPITRYAVNAMDKVPITFSVEMEAERSDVFALPTVKSLRMNIKGALEETGLFSNVSYGRKDETNPYHIAFVFRQAGMCESDSFAVGFLAGYSLFLIPTGEVYTFDGSAVLSLEGKPIYSTAKAEEIRCLIWLPMAPVGLFMNSWTVWHCLEKGSVRALVEDIALEHKKRFLKDSAITVIEDR